MEQLLPPDKLNSINMGDPESRPAKRSRRGIVARVLHGTGAAAVSYGLGIASNLLLLPLYLRFWSVAAYGEWMAIYSIVNYLASLDFGVTTAAVNAATVAYARGDRPTFKRILGTAWAVSLVLAGFGGTIVAALSLFYFHVDHWLGLTVSGHAETRLVFCALAVSVLANIPGRQLITVYIATGEFAKFQWLQNAFILLTLLVTALALVAGAHPVALATVVAAASLSTIAFSLWLLSRNGAGLYPHLRDADWHTARTLAAPTGQFGLMMFANALTVQGPIIVLSRMLGGPAVALFTTTRTVANVIRGTVILVRLPFRPEIAAASAQTSKKALRRLFRLAVSVDTVISTTTLAALWSGGGWLITFWSRGHIHPDFILLHWLLIVVVLTGFLNVLTVAGSTTNRIRAVSQGQVAVAVISLVLAVALVRTFGSSAIPLATIVPLIVIMTPVAVFNACNEAHLTVQFVCLQLIAPFAALATIAAVFSDWFISLHLGSKWFSLAIMSTVVCVVSVLVTSAVSLTGDDRQLMRDRIVSWFRRKNEQEPLLVTR